MDRPQSLFDRLISHPRRPWTVAAAVVLLLAFPFAAAYADGVLSQILAQGKWLGLLTPPVVVAYILVVTPLMARMDNAVVASLRPIVLVDESSFERLVRESSRIEPRHEWLAFGAGVLVGVLTLVGSVGAMSSWLALEWFLSSVLMYGMLGWTIYAALAGTRLVGILLRQPLRVDPFDTTPFETVGRQSLLLALVFVGGITLSLVLTALQQVSFREPALWLVYVPLVFVAVIVFFLGMYPTHRVLAAARDRELEAVQRHLQCACRALLERLEQNQAAGDLPAEINALVAYDQRLQAASTWPYNVVMLRTLFVSVLIPGGTLVGRIIVDALSP